MTTLIYEIANVGKTIHIIYRHDPDSDLLMYDDSSSDSYKTITSWCGDLDILESVNEDMTRTHNGIFFIPSKQSFVELSDCFHDREYDFSNILFSIFPEVIVNDMEIIRNAYYEGSCFDPVLLAKLVNSGAFSKALTINWPSPK